MLAPSSSADATDAELGYGDVDDIDRMGPAQEALAASQEKVKQASEAEAAAFEKLSLALESLKTNFLGMDGVIDKVD
jgi:hypothetical protein